MARETYVWVLSAGCVDWRCGPRVGGFGTWHTTWPAHRWNMAGSGVSATLAHEESLNRHFSGRMYSGRRSKSLDFVWSRHSAGRSFVSPYCCACFCIDNGAVNSLSKLLPTTRESEPCCLRCGDHVAFARCLIRSWLRFCNFVTSLTQRNDYNCTRWQRSSRFRSVHSRLQSEGMSP